MNRIYRLVWSHALNAFVVVSELATTQGKKHSVTHDARRTGMTPPLLLALGLLGSWAGSARAGDPRLDELLSIADKYAPSVSSGVEVPLNAQSSMRARVDVGPAAAASPGSTTSPSSSAAAPPRPATLAASLDTALIAGTLQGDASVRAQLAAVRAAADLGLTVTANDLPSVLRDELAAPAGRVVAHVADGVAPVVEKVAPRTRARVQPRAQALAAGVATSGRQLATGDAGGALATALATLAQSAQGTLTDAPALGQALIDDKRHLLQGTGQVVTSVADKLLPGRENLLGPVKDAVATTVGLVEGGGDGRLPNSLGEVVIGTTGAIDTGVRGVGGKLGQGVAAVTGSPVLGHTVTGVTAQVGGGVQQIGGQVVAGNVPAVVSQANHTVQGVVGTTLGGLDGVLAGSTGGSVGLTAVGTTVNGVLAQVGGSVDGLLKGQGGSSQPVAQALAGAVGDVVGTAGATTAQLLSTAPQQTVPVALNGVGQTVANLGQTLAATPAVGDVLVHAGTGVQATAQQLGSGNVGGAVGSVTGTVQTALQDLTAGLGQVGDGGAGNVGATLGGVVTQTGNVVEQITGSLGSALNSAGGGSGAGAALGNTVTQVGTTVGQVTDTLGGALAGAGNGSGGTGNLGATLGGVVTQTGNVAEHVTGSLGSALNSAGGGSGAGAALGNTVTQVGTTVGQVTDTLGGALAGAGNGSGGTGNLGATLGGVVTQTGNVAEQITGSLGSALNSAGGGSGAGAALGNTVTQVGTTVGQVTDTLGGALAGAGNGSGGTGNLGATLGGVVTQTGNVAEQITGSLGSALSSAGGGGGAGAALGNTVTQVGTTVGQVTDTLGGALAGAGNGSGGTGNLGATLGGVVTQTGNVAEQVTGSLGSALSSAGGGSGAGAALGNTVTQVGTTVSQVTGTLGGALAGSGGGTGTGGGNPVGQAVTGLLGGVTQTVGNVVGSVAGNVVNGVTGGVAPVVSGVGQTLGNTVGAVTGSTALASTVTGATGSLASGLTQVGGELQQGDLGGAVGSLGNTIGTVGSGAITGVTGAVGGLTGSTSGTGGLGGTLGGVVGGIGSGLGNVVGGLTGAAPAAAPTVPPQVGSPGLIIGTGGLTGSLGGLLDSTTTGLFGGDGYVRNGDLAVSNANFQQGYAVTNVLGVPVVNTTPVGTLLNGVGGAATGGNSHLTLLGGVTSDSYLYNINNGNPGGLLGLLLPDGSPAWAGQCANLLGLATTDCWAVNAAQDYQVLIGDGAYSNGSKEVVIGTNARHQLAAQDADLAFPGAGRDDPNNPTGVPTADYDARLGHSVVIGDNATGTANAQTLLGAGATSNKANTVALGYLSNADRGGQDNYMAYGLTSARTSIGEVAVGSAGRERQITHVAAGSAATDAVNVEQLQGAINQINQVDIFAVTYDTDASGNPDYSRVTLGTVGSATATVIGNLAAGEVSLNSTEAINGAQLYALGQGTSLHLGGGSTVDANGVPTAPTYVINNIGNDGSVSIGTYDNVGSALAAISQSLGNIDPAAADVLAVHYDADASGNALNHVTLAGAGTGAAVGISNVADGTIALGSTDAVTGGQLFQTHEELAAFLGGTTAYDSATGTWTAPQFAISSFDANGNVTVSTYHDVTTAFGAVDGSLTNLNNRVRNISVNSSPYLAVNSTGGAAAADGDEGVALGPDASASGEGSLALGSGAVASASGSIALGSGSVASRANSVSVGSVGNERQIVNVAAGAVAQGSTDAVNGGQLYATNSQVANYFGGTTTYDSNTGTWTGPSFNITSVSTTGGTTRTTYNNVSSAFEAVDGSIVNINQRIDNLQDGAGSEYFSVNSTGAPAAATGAEAIAIGPQATATAANSVALGAGAVADRANAVSVGSAGNERQVINVADGTTATDAVNVRQLQASQAGTVRYDTTNGQTNYGSVTLGQGNTPTQVHNVAAGTADNDAVNLGQLKSGMADAMDWSKNYTDSRIQGLDNRASAGVASAMAMAGLPQPYEAGRSMASVAASTYNGESGIAVGIAGVTEGGRWIYKVSGSTNSRGEGGVSVGAGIQW
ncbi:ESPR-type extended signal peptide-containing protein [Stenotrophomonas sp. HITSZ_GD]|uniref:ESPR-type extended signal peptide-containing protein n=1 Tax=Stenotrophomonas sp. HITSZ_GD TaxID=3037248 RepID=UPI00240DD0D0|nr:ESPR-type extended signal peptide-containing protein [Stenotrophomonas sp. HITSZ_GD]MDG2524447.1 ESPR-type extended signal peptide-containing protein [Stenotrophomonas sp. HITSZ_GD]